MNWYKKSQNIRTTESQIISDIVLWLEQANQGNTDLSMVDDDISMRMSGIDDFNILLSAIDKASSIVSEKQGGILSEGQNYIISMLKQRVA